MDVKVHEDKAALGKAAAAEGVAAIAEALGSRGEAHIVVATGASQFEMLEGLVAADLDWSKVHVFHLDEYVGISADHPASFRRYLRERFVERLPALGSFTAIDGDAADLQDEVARLNRAMADAEVDVCFAGIGENCHLAFNDPPADFDTTDPYLVVTLDEACRRQQMGEGWFPSISDVPDQAISMSIRQILKARRIVLSVPDERKSEAVRAAVEGPVTNAAPASILQTHPRTSLHLDRNSASRLSRG